jgi:spore maturation protein CgeB
VRKVPGGAKVVRRLPRIGHLADAPSLAPSAVELADSIYNASRPSAFGRAMYQSIRDSKLTLNTHIDAAKDNASNMRMFEATGVGTCMLTERQSDLADIFEPDREVVTYASHEECVEKAVWLLGHDKEREAIGLAGQKRVMKDHRWDQRAAWLDGQIKTLLTKRA